MSDVQQPDSGQSIRGESVPKEWDTTTIGAISKRMADGGTPDRDRDDEFFGGNINWVVVKDVAFKIDDSTEKLTEAGLDASTATLWPEGSVIVTTGASIGKVGVAEVPTATKQGITGIVPAEAVNSHFLARYLEAKKKLLNRFAQGTTFEEIRPYILEKIELPLPPLNEQRKIASVLYTVDKAIGETSSIIERLQVLKRGLIQDLFCDNWPSAKIGSFCTVESGLSWSKDQERDSSDDDVVRVVTVKNVQNGFLDMDDELYLANVDKEKYNRYRLHDGSLLMIGSSGSGRRVGQCGLVEGDREAVYASFLYRLEPNRKVMLPRFLFYVLNRSRFQRRLTSLTVGSTSLKNLNKTEVRGVEVPRPSIETQERVVDILSCVDKGVQRNREYRRQLEVIKKGLTQDLLTGEVRTQAVEIEIPEEVTAYG